MAWNFIKAIDFLTAVEFAFYFWEKRMVNLMQLIHRQGFTFSSLFYWDLSWGFAGTGYLWVVENWLEGNIFCVVLFDCFMLKWHQRKQDILDTMREQILAHFSHVQVSKWVFFFFGWAFGFATSRKLSMIFSWNPYISFIFPWYLVHLSWLCLHFAIYSTWN